MTPEPLDKNISARICKHMNDDHPDALIQFAKRYGGIIQPNNVKMIDLTPIALKLDVDGKPIEIAFDHELVDSADAHLSLVKMLRQ